MFVNLFIFFVAGCITAQESEKIELGMNVITQCVVPGMVALTYDDGVSEYTSDLLEVLKSEKVRATFFVLGQKLSENKGLARSMLRKMWDAGHDIGSHTFNHPHLTSMSEAQIVDEMEKTDSLIGEFVGSRPLLMRPPFGDINPMTAGLLQSMGYIIVNWNTDSGDWRLTNLPPSEVAKNVMNMIPPRSSNPGKSYILLQHDTLQPTVKAQREIIRDLKAKGYRFGNMSECLGGAKVYRKNK